MLFQEPIREDLAISVLILAIRSNTASLTTAHPAAAASPKRGLKETCAQELPDGAVVDASATQIASVRSRPLCRP